MNADGSRIVVTTTETTSNNSSVHFATWSQSTSTYTGFTRTLDLSTSRRYQGTAISQDGTMIAYADQPTGIVYVAYWNGSNYGIGKPIYSYTTIGVGNSRNLVFSLDKKIIYYSTIGVSSLYTSYYNPVTQSYGLFYLDTTLQIQGGNRDGWPICMSPDGATLYLGSYGVWNSMVSLSTVQYMAYGPTLQIQLAKPAKLTSYGFLTRRDLTRRMPKKFVILGSNDGQIWYLVDAQNEQSTDYNTRTNLTTGATTNTYLPPVGDSTLIAYGTSTTYASNFYSYYRVVTIGIYATNGFGGGGANGVNIGQVVMRGIYL
jgi:hypothetical protein